MSIQRIFRRNSEKKGKASRHYHRGITMKELKDFPEHLIEKAVLRKCGLWDITEWRRA